MLPAFAITLLACIVAYWLWNRFLSSASKTRREQARAATAALREAVLSRRFLSDDSRLAQEKGYVMDWNVGGGQVATLVSFTDGTTSLYFSSGGGRIGLGEVDTVIPVATHFRDCLATASEHFSATRAWPEPAPGNYVFYVLDREQTLATAPASSKQIRNPAHPLHHLAAAGQQLITAARKAKASHAAGGA